MNSSDEDFLEIIEDNTSSSVMTKSNATNMNETQALIKKRKMNETEPKPKIKQSLLGDCMKLTKTNEKKKGTH